MSKLVLRIVGSRSPEMCEAVDTPRAVDGENPTEECCVPGCPEVHSPHVHRDQSGQDESEQGHQNGVVPVEFMQTLLTEIL